MKQIPIIKPGTRCRDKATTLMGSVTHVFIGMDAQGAEYLFQPYGLTETGEPMERRIVETARLDTPADSVIMFPFPVEILGTAVTDPNSGYTGMATGFVLHRGLCLHVQVQAAAQPPSPGGASKNPPKPIECDLRELEGEAIPELSPEEKDKSREEVPSPGEPMPPRHRNPDAR